MGASVEASGRETFVIELRLVGQTQELTQQTRLARTFALRQQRFGMIRILDVLVTIEAAGVAGHEAILVVDAQPVRVGFDGQTAPGILRWH